MLNLPPLVRVFGPEEVPCGDSIALVMSQSPEARETHETQGGCQNDQHAGGQDWRDRRPRDNYRHTQERVAAPVSDIDYLAAY